MSPTSAVRGFPTEPVADVSQSFATLVVERFSQRVGERFALCLSGGPTAEACYRYLASHCEGIDWSLVDVYMGDERFVLPTDPDANQRLVRETLLDPVGGVGSFRPMPTEGPVGVCVADYQQLIASVLDHAGIDLIHLGLGPDGHTASLFPGASTLVAPDTEFVAATTDPNGRNPHPRLTLTLPAINRAHIAVFTVAGTSKSEAVDLVRHDAEIPATKIDTAEVVWLIDADAFFAKGGSEVLGERS